MLLPSCWLSDKTNDPLVDRAYSGQETTQMDCRADESIGSGGGCLKCKCVFTVVGTESATVVY